MADRASLGPLATAAMTSSAVIMAYQVASRATRDTLFLSTYPVGSLPLMIAGASVFSIAAALLATRGMVRLGPARFMPIAFVGSALLTLAEWVLAWRQPGLAAVAVYLHVGALAAVLISGVLVTLKLHIVPRRQDTGGGGTTLGVCGGV